MNLHLIVIFGHDAEDSPLAAAIRNQGIGLKVLSGSIRLNYPSKLKRIFVGLPRLLFFSLSTAIKSLRDHQQADVVIANSHIDLVAFQIVSSMLRCKRPKIVLPGFIFTEKQGAIASYLNKRYFSWCLQFADTIICHSKKEVGLNNQRFPQARGKFIYFPYGTHVWRNASPVDATIESTTAVCAGRSGRDFGLLVEAARGIPVQFRVICDQFPKSLEERLPENVTVLSSCYHECYFEELEQCRFVVIPLRPDDISAGQMVLLQAMAMGKPCVITETETTRDYIRDGTGMISVPPNDQDALRAALMRLFEDDTLCARLAREAEREFINRYSIEAYAKNLVTSARLASTPEHNSPLP